ncbi:heme biosynthesis protein HemY [Limibaculum sp. FT325]|uniref:heme biosynthesis protein HemY n=1 Tax=Thermohalobaculum sediminis TaxID=2939436 RepID=UPI0020BF72BF|nr:heme biosynthesis HemY N-terminal domain-containing protein [Limibaculum sediminis]MCL5777260.1 heme biosynthesis protein HemY [Limibaculum sediminis]
MLGSVIRISLFIAVVAAITFGVNHLMQTPGGISIRFGEWEFALTPLMFVAMTLAGFLGLWLLFKVVGLAIALLRFVMGDETAISRFFDRKNERSGLRALTQALVALQSGDARRAKAKAQKAERLLQKPELTRLVSAQAAELAGDRDRARIYYKALADGEGTEFVGVRGLLRLAMEDGDSEKALVLARTAAGLNGSDAEVLDALYTLQSRKFDWAAARTTLAAQRRAKALPEPEARRRDAMLALAQSEDAEAAGNAEAAMRFAVEAAKTDPANPEAVGSAARLLAAAGQARTAAKLITDGWKVAPSPGLAAAFAALEPDEAPAARRRRFERLLESNRDHPEGHFIRAELALLNRDWAEARSQIQRIDANEPTARYCAIMAAIARGEGRPENEVRAWLARAVGAPRDDGADAILANAAMLPLIIGDDPAPHDTAPRQGTNGSGTKGSGDGAAASTAEGNGGDAARATVL